MTWPAPTRADHDSFCRIEGWAVVRNATHKKTGHHVTYELALLDGSILRTRVSRPPNRTGYGKSMWSHILRDQLQVDEATFWACVNEKTLPDRGGRRLSPPDAIPLEVASLLRTKVGLSESELSAMTKAEAVARLNLFWGQQGQ